MEKCNILFVIWDVNGLGFNESLDPVTVSHNRESAISYIPGVTTWQFTGTPPIFQEKLTKFIISDNPDLVVIGFSNEKPYGSYYHSHFLPCDMSTIGYVLIEKIKSTYVQSLNLLSLRLSFYKKKDCNRLTLTHKKFNTNRTIICNINYKKIYNISFIFCCTETQERDNKSDISLCNYNFNKNIEESDARPDVFFYFGNIFYPTERIFEEEMEKNNIYQFNTIFSGDGTAKICHNGINFTVNEKSVNILNGYGNKILCASFVVHDGE